MKQKFVTLSALTLISMIGASAANAQPTQPLPQVERQIFRFESQTPSYLGVQTENVTNDNFGKYNLNEARGVAVTKVLENGPAAVAGLRDKDVILRFDGEEVKSTVKLLRLISEVAPDQKARLTIYRNGGEQEITVTMGKRPASQASPNLGNAIPFGEFRQMIPQLPGDFRNFEFLETPNDSEGFFNPREAQGRRLGVGVVQLTKQLGETYGAPEGKGLLINEVSAASAAEKAGLKAGDVILEIDGAAISNQTELIRALNKKNEGEVVLTVLRNKQRQTIRVTPEAPQQQAAPANKGTKFRI